MEIHWSSWHHDKSLKQTLWLKYFNTFKVHQQFSILLVKWWQFKLQRIPTFVFIQPTTVHSHHSPKFASAPSLDLKKGSALMRIGFERKVLLIWLVVSTHPKYLSRNGNLPHEHKKILETTASVMNEQGIHQLVMVKILMSPVWWWDVPLFCFPSLTDSLSPPMNVAGKVLQ